MQTLRIEELELDLYFSNKKMEYVFVDKPIDKIEVLVACTNETQPAKKSCKEPVKQTLG